MIQFVLSKIHHDPQRLYALGWIQHKFVNHNDSTYILFADAYPSLDVLLFHVHNASLDDSGKAKDHL